MSKSPEKFCNPPPVSPHQSPPFEEDWQYGANSSVSTDDLEFLSGPRPNEEVEGSDEDDNSSVPTEYFRATDDPLCPGSKVKSTILKCDFYFHMT